MNVINLADATQSTIEYTINKFPDGQQDVIINSELDHNTDVLVASRMNSFQDLELIVCATKALRRMGVQHIHLYAPYILGARSDRKFVEGGTIYVTDVVAPIINSLKFKTVVMMDAHSAVTESVIENASPIPVEEVVMRSEVIQTLFETREVAIVSPDAGALKKVYAIAEELEYEGDIIIANKHRDVATGKISHTSVPITNKEIKTYIIFDDICDGGRTFVEIAKVIKAEVEDAEIFLYITHGIFSATLEPLKDYFTGIICTNSISVIDDPIVEQIDIWS